MSPVIRLRNWLIRIDKENTSNPFLKKGVVKQKPKEIIKGSSIVLIYCLDSGDEVRAVIDQDLKINQRVVLKKINKTVKVGKSEIHYKATKPHWKAWKQDQKIIFILVILVNTVIIYKFADRASGRVIPEYGSYYYIEKDKYSSSGYSKIVLGSLAYDHLEFARWVLAITSFIAMSYFTYSLIDNFYEILREVIIGKPLIWFGPHYIYNGFCLLKPFIIANIIYIIWLIIWFKYVIDTQLWWDKGWL